MRVALPNLPVPALYPFCSPYSDDWRVVWLVLRQSIVDQPLLCLLMCHRGSVRCRSARVGRRCQVLLSILDDLWVSPLPSIAIWMCVFPLEKSTSRLFYPAWQYRILVRRVTTLNSTGFFVATQEWFPLLSLLNLSDLVLCCNLNVLLIRE